MLAHVTNQNVLFQQKYTRTKRMAKELQADIKSRDEFYQQLLQEKDTEYNALVKSLKDRVSISNHSFKYQSLILFLKLFKIIFLI